MTRVSAALLLLIAMQPAAVAETQPTTAAHGVITVQTKEKIRIVYGVKTDEWHAGIVEVLYYIRGLYEAYRTHGVTADQFDLSIVLHGPTVYWLLKDEACQNHTLDPFSVNPNDHVIESLLALGASIEACNSTMKGKGWTHEDLLRGVRLEHDGYTRLIDLQQRGYGYVRF